MIKQLTWPGLNAVAQYKPVVLLGKPLNSPVDTRAYTAYYMMNQLDMIQAQMVELTASFGEPGRIRVITAILP